MWIFHKFGLSLGVRVGGTMPRQWLSVHSNGRASWLNDYDFMSFCLSWSHMVHTGRHGRTGKEEKDIDHFSSNNENKTRQPLENWIPGKAPLSPSFPWLTFFCKLISHRCVWTRTGDYGMCVQGDTRIEQLNSQTSAVDMTVMGDRQDT